MQASDNFVYAYLRLSREDLEQPGLMAEKWQRMAATAQELAARHGLTLPADHILIEQESGRRLKNRPVLLRLMDLMHAGQCQTLITPFQDRLDRLEDKREQADLEDALYAGCVTILSRDGATRYDDDLDPLPAEVRALIARHELRLYARRRREANRQRLRQNKPSCGFPPYGYTRTGTTYEPIPAQYAVLVEILRRAQSGEAYNAIARDLNARGVPSPAACRSASSSGLWNRNTLRLLVQNPFYAGYHARRSRPLRGGGKQRLDPQDYELAETEGDWPHPLTLGEWLTMQQRFRAQPSGVRSLLHGLLYCPHGSRMRRHGEGNSYRCDCPGRTHGASQARWDRFAGHLVCAVLDAIPAAWLSAPVETAPAEDAAALDKALARAHRAQQERQREHDTLLRDLLDPTSYLRRFDRDEVERLIDQTKAELAAARQDVETLTARRNAPDLGRVRTLLAALRQMEGAARWARVSEATRREVLNLFVARLDLVGRGPGQQVKRAAVTWQPWVIEHGLTVPIDPGWSYHTHANRPSC